MAEAKNIFQRKVVPVMNKVREELQNRQADELRDYLSSARGIMAGAVGPDGGMTDTAAGIDTLRYTGKWNSKTVEDYVAMVKAELKRQHITVTPEIERMMIDKMVKDKIPKASIDYIIQTAARHSLFSLPQQGRTTPLQAEIETRAEAAYNPSKTEKAIAWGLGNGADFLATGGFGGGWKGAATFFGGSLLADGLAGSSQAQAANAPASTPTTNTMQDDKYKNVPLVIAPEHRDDYLRFQEQQKKAETEVKTTEETSSVKHEQPTENVEPQVSEQQAEQPEQSKISGWDGLLQSFGLNGFSDIGKNMGYVLAMLPDVLVGLFTGKTKSLNVDNSMLPLASIVAGMFVGNPILKMLLVGMGGANLINKAGHEVLEQKQNESVGAALPQYKVYADEPLNPRITNPVLQGGCLIANIDKVPCTIQLPEHVVGAYQAGVLPINTLANAVLAKSDRMQQMASAQYEEQRQETITRTRGIQ